MNTSTTLYVEIKAVAGSGDKHGLKLQTLQSSYFSLNYYCMPNRLTHWFPIINKSNQFYLFHVYTCVRINPCIKHKVYRRRDFVINRYLARLRNIRIPNF